MRSFFKTAEWLRRDVCIYLSAAGCKLLSPTLPSSEGDGSVGAAKWHSAVRAHVIILYSVILVKINGC